MVSLTMIDYIFRRIPFESSETCLDPWDRCYQELVSAIKDDCSLLENNLRLAELVGQFQELTKFLGQKIIDQYHLRRSNNQAEALIYGEILFHFAADYEGMHYTIFARVML
jgi:hypothetical protein